MANYKGRTIYYKPRMTDMEAMEVLPQPIKEALWEAVTSWSAYSILRRYRKLVREAPKVNARDIDLDDLDGPGSDPHAHTIARMVKEWDVWFMEKERAPAWVLCHVPPCYGSQVGRLEAVR